MTTSSLQCRLCGETADELFSLRVLRQFDVRYYRCAHCDLIQTEEPYWLAQAYSTAYSALDVGVLNRNLFCSRLTLAVATLLGVPWATPCLDYGGGNGIFTRLMRDAGCNFLWHDKIGPNLYVRGFEGEPQIAYALVTCFEVFEHFANVHDELAALFRPRPDFVLVGTFLHSNPGKDWWYLVPDSGQHVAFYSRQTMQQIGTLFGYEAVCGEDYVLFIRHGKKVAAWRRALIGWILNSNWLANVVGFLFRQTRSTEASMARDHAAVKAKMPADRSAVSPTGRGGMQTENNRRDGQPSA
ncbi:MAG TPA: class I SAM-dependent methyltransferase [Gemmataceae bacterium]|nr:class I SAM-dependent methyltransferase [Gemmataceae bacterium]